MTKDQFILAIMAMFNKSEEKDHELIEGYRLGLSTTKNVDWAKLYHRCIHQLEERKLPMPKWFISQYDYCLAGNGYNRQENDGTKVFVRLTDGYEYEFELYNCSKSQAEIRQGLKRKFSHWVAEKEQMETFVDSITFVKEDETEQGMENVA